MASADPSIEETKDVVEVNFSSIKALNTPATDKDSWSYKGTITGVPAGFDYVDFVLDNGVDLDLLPGQNSRDSSRSNSPFDEVSFDHGCPRRF